MDSEPDTSGDVPDELLEDAATLVSISSPSLLGPGDRIAVQLLSRDFEPSREVFHYGDGDDGVQAELILTATEVARHHLHRREVSVTKATREIRGASGSVLAAALRRYVEVQDRLDRLPGTPMSRRLQAVQQRCAETFWGITEYQATLRRQQRIAAGAAQGTGTAGGADEAAAASVLRIEGKLAEALERLGARTGGGGVEDLLAEDVKAEGLRRLLDELTLDGEADAEGIADVLGEDPGGR